MVFIEGSYFRWFLWWYPVDSECIMSVVWSCDLRSASGNFAARRITGSACRSDSSPLPRARTVLLTLPGLYARFHFTASSPVCSIVCLFCFFCHCSYPEEWTHRVIRETRLNRFALSLKEIFTLKHIQYSYKQIFLLCLLIPVLQFCSVMYFRYHCDKLAVVCRADVTEKKWTRSLTWGRGSFYC